MIDQRGRLLRAALGFAGLSHLSHERGLVASLARPGGNLTGLDLRSSDLIAKRFEVLKETVPTISRVAALNESTNPFRQEIRLSPPCRPPAATAGPGAPAPAPDRVVRAILAEAGSLLTLGTNTRELCQRSAVFVHKILRGATPAELPIERVDKFPLVVSLRTAKALGLTIPQSLLVRADELIQ